MYKFIYRPTPKLPSSPLLIIIGKIIIQNVIDTKYVIAVKDGDKFSLNISFTISNLFDFKIYNEKSQIDIVIKYIVLI